MLLIAQLIERLVVAQEVAGLSPAEEPIFFVLLPHDKGLAPASTGRRAGTTKANSVARQLPASHWGMRVFCLQGALQKPRKVLCLVLTRRRNGYGETHCRGGCVD